MATFDSVNPARPADVVGTFRSATAADVDRAVAAAADAQRAWARRPVPGARRAHRRRRRRARRAQGRAARRSSAARRARCSSRRAATCRRPSTWPLRRRAGPSCVGRDRAVRAGEQDGVDDPPAGRRRRDDHAVELPGGDPVVEVLPRAARRQRHRAQAVRARAACAEAFVDALRRGRHPGRPRAGRARRTPSRRRRSPCTPASARCQLHRLGAHRPQGGGRGDGDRAHASCRSSSAARTRWSCSPTPTSTSSSTARSSAPSARPGSAAPRPRGSIVHRDVADELVERHRQARRARSCSATRLDPATDVGPVIDRRLGRAHRRRWSTPRSPRAPTRRHAAATLVEVDGLRGRHVRRADGAHRRASPTHRIAREEVFGPVLVGDRGRRPRRGHRRRERVEYGLSAAVYTRDINAALRAVDAHRHRHRLRQRADDRRRDPAAVRRHEAHRQRLPRGGHPRHRAVQPDQDRLRRLLGPAAAGADRHTIREDVDDASIRTRRRDRTAWLDR